MLKDLLFVIWIFIPAGIANMTPVLAAHIPAIRHLDMPLDGGRSFRGRRIFGEHKTWRGLLTGMLAATIVLALMQLLAAHIGWFAGLGNGLDITALPALLVGPLFGLGVLGGDAIKSFFKRQVGIRPGHSWFPFDQIDYIVGAVLAVLPFIQFTGRQLVLLVLVWGAATMIATYIGWLLHMRDAPM